MFCVARFSRLFMNASPLASSRPSSDSASAPISSPSPARKRSLRSLLGTITGICFVFGALAAVQVRTITNIEKARVQKNQNDNLQKQIAAKNSADADKAAQEAAKQNEAFKKTIATLRDGSNLSAAQIRTLTAQIKSLQVQACLTPVSGSGIRIVLSDNPQAADGGGNPSLPLPGLVHDYDVLQVVNELRAAKADAIAVHGAGGNVIRVTGTTPIRCVGPVIFINWNAVAAPFTIEAVGDSKTLKSALDMPGGIVENLRVQGAVGVKISSETGLSVPAADSTSFSAPTTQVATTQTAPAANGEGTSKQKA